MKQKEIIKKLIDYYSAVINKYEATGDYDVIFDNDCQSGICYCARRQFKVDICNKEWVTKYSVWPGYWFDTPWSAGTKEYNLRCLNLRVDKLKEIYEQGIN